MTIHTTFADAALTRRADIRPESFNEEHRTVEAVISTGADYPRRDARGPFAERLDLSAIREADLVGLPVLDGHRQGGSEHVVGTITTARREAPGIVATIRLSEADDVRSAVTKIREGVLRGVSIGYHVTTWADGTDERGGRVRTAKQWRIHEVSLVSVPADAGAVVRKGNPPMPEQIVNEPIGAQSRAEVRTQIRAVAKAAGLTPEWADSQIDGDADLTAVRAAAFVEQQRRAPTIHVQQVGPSNDDPAVIRSRMAEALACRMTGATPSDAARPYMGASLLDNTRALLAMRGESTRTLNAEQVFTRAAQHTTSDFPILTTEAGNRVLAAAYQRAASPVRALARERKANDFRPINIVSVGEFSGLQKVTESGEIKAMTTGESKEAFALETAGGLFNLSRKAIVNDDLNAFGRWGEMMGRAAAEYEATQVIALLTQASGAGPLLSDGVRLFNASHGNVAASGGDIVGTDGDLSALSDARKALRDMKGLDGKTPINATPKYLLVGTARETEAEQALAAIYAATADTANVFTGKLTILVEPRLGAAPWFVFADPAVLPVIECAYLSGAEGPQLASREGWDVLGREFRVILDFGCGAVDFRGAYRNAGA